MKKLPSFLVVLLLVLSRAIFAQSVDSGEGDESDVSTCINLSSKVLKYKSRDAETNGEVSVLQDYLFSKSFLAQGASGFYGLKTVEAVKKYQRSVGLPVSGSVGSLTKKAVYNDTCTTQTTSTVSTTSPLVQSSVKNNVEIKKKELTGDSLAGVTWGNNAYLLADKPEAKDKWRDRLGVKDLPESSYLRIQFDKTFSNTDLVKKENMDGVTLVDYNKSSGYFGVPGIKSENLAVFWGKKISISKKEYMSSLLEHMDLIQGS